MLAVERFDVRCGGGDPIGHDFEIAAVAARLVGQFPGEDGWRGVVAAHYGLDVCLVLSLSFLARVPLCVGSDAGVLEVSRHAAVVSPVVDEVDDELDAVLFCALDDIVEALKAVGAGVDFGLAVDERLVVDLIRF